MALLCEAIIANSSTTLASKTLGALALFVEWMQMTLKSSLTRQAGSPPLLLHFIPRLQLLHYMGS
eukprot:5565353-Prorocentrum_lima.AAC.1